jgi:hypothetical protein
MDADRFDALSRALTSSQSRRATLGALLGSLLGGALPGLSSDSLAAASKKSGKKTGKKHGGRKHDRQTHDGASNDQGKTRKKSASRKGHAQDSTDEQAPESMPEATVAESREDDGDAVSVASHGCGHAGARCRKGSQCCTGKCIGKRKCSCDASNPCPESVNPCKEAVCSATGKCGLQNKPDGTACGDGKTCQDGQCPRLSACTVCKSGCRYTTITDAVIAASNGATITVAPGIYQEVHPNDDAGRGLMLGGKTLTLRRCGETGEVVLRNARHYGYKAAMWVSGPSEVTVEDFIITRNPEFEYGVGILNWGKVTLLNCTVTGCIHEPSVVAGGIHNSGILTMRGGAVTENRAPSGAGIYNEGSLQSILPGAGSVTLIGVEVSRNVATSSGAGYYDHDDRTSLTLTDCTIKDNVTEQAGAGIYSQAAKLRLTNTTISDNTAQYNVGGGIAYGGPDMVLEDSTVTRNSATNGGGVYLAWWGSPGSFVMSGTSTITENIPNNCAGNSSLEGCQG